LPLTTATPISATLYNCDTDRDAFPGLLIAKGAKGSSESDPTKYQAWRTSPLSTNLTINGTASLTIWSAVKDFNTVKSGRITVFLRDFDGVNHREIAQGSLAQPNWSGGSSSWVEKTVTFAAVNYTLLAGHQLEIKLIVDSGSADDTWFAYDTVSYASRLQLP